MTQQRFETFLNTAHLSHPPLPQRSEGVYVLSDVPFQVYGLSPWRLVILGQQDGSKCSNHINEMLEAEHQNYLYDIIRYRVWKCMDILHCENANVHLTIHGLTMIYIYVELYTSCTHTIQSTHVYTQLDEMMDGLIDQYSRQRFIKQCQPQTDKQTNTQIYTLNKIFAIPTSWIEEAAHLRGCRSPSAFCRCGPCFLDARMLSNI